MIRLVCCGCIIGTVVNVGVAVVIGAMVRIISCDVVTWFLTVIRICWC